jgi:hypothetical protein
MNNLDTWIENAKYNDEPNILNIGLNDLSSFGSHHKMVKIASQDTCIFRNICSEIQEKRKSIPSKMKTRDDQSVAEHLVSLLFVNCPYKINSANFKFVILTFVYAKPVIEQKLPTVFKFKFTKRKLQTYEHTGNSWVGW